MKKQNPFSTTFSKMPEYTYISTAEPKRIIENFSFDSPTESVYKITGLRGSGKTVMLSDVQNEFRREENREKGWLVYNLNPSRDMLSQFAAALYSESFIKKEAKRKGISFSATVLGNGVAIGYSGEKNDYYLDIGIEIKKMLEAAADNKKKILLCVDEISKTPEMVVFALEFEGWLIAGYPVFFVCTGLYENISELGNTKNLTFFRRGTTIETKPLNFILMSEMYKKNLVIDVDLSKRMAGMTRGYAYAFQKLGSLYFEKTSSDTLDSLIDLLKADLFSYSYEKIWEELSAEERFMTGLLTEKDEYKREEVLALMGKKAGNYSVYRDRLLKRGVITARQGYIGLNPPFFSEYIENYGRYIPD